MNEATLAWLMTPDDGHDLDGYLAQLLNRPKWQARAECRGEGVDQFFPHSKADPAEAILEMCARCSVREECLEFALADDSLTGVWGGTTSENGGRGGRPSGRWWRKTSPVFRPCEGEKQCQTSTSVE